jgi:hypothetical protein
MLYLNKNPRAEFKKKNLFVILDEKRATLSAALPYKRVPRDIFLQWIVEGFGGNVQQKKQQDRCEGCKGNHQGIVAQLR